MRTVLALLLALGAGAATSVFAQEAASIDRVEPFRPSLSVNEERLVCEPFLKAWTAVFDAPTKLEENEVNLFSAYPDARIDSLKDFYENPRTIKVDIDGDDEFELLYLDPNDVGWRYLGPSLYFFPSEKDLETFSAARGPATRWGLNFDSREPVPGAVYNEVMHLGPIASFNLLQIGGQTYFTSNVTYPTETESTAAILTQLEATGASRPFCKVELLPAKNAFARYRDGSQLFAGLRDVYGEESYHGTMGWTANPKDFAFSTLLYRPWAMPAVGRRADSGWPPPKDRAREDVARELRYLSWGAADPQSWRDYHDVKDGRARFIADLRRHYAQHFDKSDAGALELAEQAWRYLLDEIIYGRNDDGYNLVAITNNAETDLQVSPDTTPADIVRLAIEDWRKGAPLRTQRREQTSERSLRISRSLMIASVYTRQSIPFVRQQADELMGFVDHIKSEILLAALGHNGLTNLALEELGADPNTQTGGMSKTPLMYAAQLDRPNTVRLLIARGVNVNLKTDSQQSGYQPERDHRTALMYAAENASPTVIDAILEAGADISAKDTKGNTALWYFGLNTRITDPAERERIAKRLGG